MFCLNNLCRINQYLQNDYWSVSHTDLDADKKRLWIPAIGIKSIDTRIMNVSVPLNLGILSKSQI